MIPLWIVAGGSALAGIVALLSGWGLISPEYWWQALLSLGVLQVTMWSALGALRQLNREVDAHWFPREAMWVLVGIIMIYVVVIATYVAPVDNSLLYDDYLYDDLGTDTLLDNTTL
jgi:hypothetical protein